MDIKAKAEEILKKLKGDDKLMEKFHSGRSGPGDRRIYQSETRIGQSAWKNRRTVWEKVIEK